MRGTDERSGSLFSYVTDASEAELAAGTGHSITRSAAIFNVYNPPFYALAKSAQDKRHRHKKRNRRGTKV